MNYKQHLICLSALVWASSLGFATEMAEEKVEKKEMTKEEVFSEENVTKLSETYGHLIYKSLNNPIFKFDIEAVFKGMRDAQEGKTSPMTDQEYEEAIGQIQELSFKEMAETNLKAADEFLVKNLSEKGVIELEKGKLQALVLQEGTGEEVTEETIPVIHYLGKYLDGTVFGNSQETGNPISIDLKHTIPGFRQGVLGMKVGEKRRLFIHPDIGYGTSGQLLPNSLLVFEIEVTKLEKPSKEEKEAEKESKLSSEDELDDIDENDDVEEEDFE